MKKTCVIVSTMYCPTGSASGLRISSVVDVLIGLGYDCHVIGLSDYDVFRTHEVKPGYTVHSIYNVKRKNNAFEKLKVFLYPKKRFKTIIEGIKRERKIDLLMVYQQLPLQSSRYILNVAKKEKIKILYDFVEWQVLGQQNLVSYFTFYRPNQKYIKKYSKYGLNIAISTFLNEYFLSQNIDSLYVPFFFDIKSKVYIEDNKPFKPDQNKIYLGYFGKPFGGRDTIINAIKGILLLAKEKQAKFEFIMAGPNDNDLIKLGLTPAELEAAQPFLKVLGRIPHEQLVDIYKYIDYTILLKPAEKRFSKAGFPTKVSESLSYAVPSICNLTGDLELFLEHGKNAVVLASDSPGDFAKGMEEVLAINEKQYLAMRKDARFSAETKLDISVYSEKIKELLTKKSPTEE